MPEIQNLISIIELRRLLIELKDKRPDVCFRYRLLGEMWAQHFMVIIKVTEKGVMLNDEVMNKIVNVTDISTIMQFELDNRFQQYQPYFHYDVKASHEFEP